MSSKRELRFGHHGSLAVMIAGPKAGLWHDHEVQEGGDLLALIMRVRGVRGAERSGGAIYEEDFLEPEGARNSARA